MIFCFIFSYILASIIFAMRKPAGVVVSLSSLRGKHNRGGGGGARKSEEG